MLGLGASSRKFIVRSFSYYSDKGLALICCLLQFTLVSISLRPLTDAEREYKKPLVMPSTMVGVTSRIHIGRLPESYDVI